MTTEIEMYEGFIAAYKKHAASFNGERRLTTYGRITSADIDLWESVTMLVRARLQSGGVGEDEPVPPVWGLVQRNTGPLESFHETTTVRGVPAMLIDSDKMLDRALVLDGKTGIVEIWRWSRRPFWSGTTAVTVGHCVGGALDIESSGIIKQLENELEYLKCQ